MIRRGSIKQQMLVVAVLPLLVFAFALGVYFIQGRVADSDERLTARGQTIARLLAISVEFGLLTANREMLRSQVSAHLQEDDVMDVIVLDAHFIELVRRSNTRFEILRQADYPRLEEGYGYFLAPVTTSGIPFQDLPELSEGDNSKEVIGWVAVVISQEQTRHSQQLIIIKGIVLLLGGLLGSLLLVSRFSRNIIKPVEDLTQVVRDVEAGQLWRRADDSARGEMQQLLRGFNRMAQTVEDSNTMLELRVNEQTRALRRSMADIKRNNAELTRARERADLANQAKDEFLARMSHELRTPLTSVIGFSRLLQQSGLSRDQQEYSRIINLTSGMLLSIIDDILDFSRLESGAITLETLAFDLQDTIEEVVEMLAPVADEKRIVLAMVLDPRLPRQVVGDSVRLRQVLVNLVSNAIKFTDRGAVEIHAWSQGDQIRIEVVDSGIGIPQLQLETLFSAFVQADTSITRRYGGSGLGLAISQRLTELMGGQINLNSREGAGTRVWVDLPLAVEQGPLMGPLPELKQQMLVLVEHPVRRQGLRQLFLQTGLQPQFCRDTVELHRQLALRHWDAVLVCQQAENEDYPALLRTLRRVREHHQGELVVLATGPLQLPEALNARLLHKPITRRLVNQLLEGAEGHEGGSAELPAVENLVHPVRILIAEDNSFNRLLISRVLEEAGADVLEVITGVEAVACAAEFAPDLILMDVHMPEMDGIEATRRIRAAGFERPILALTANVIEREHEVLYEVGVDEVLLKPIEDQVLIEHLNRYIEVLKAPAPDVEEAGLLALLARYRIRPQAFTDELWMQLGAIEQSLQPLDCDQIRHHSHQLIGLAGLYELPELDMVSHDLNTAARAGEGREVWIAFWRLTRIVRQVLAELQQAVTSEERPEPSIPEEVS